MSLGLQPDHYVSLSCSWCDRKPPYDGYTLYQDLPLTYTDGSPAGTIQYPLVCPICFQCAYDFTQAYAPTEVKK